MTTVSCQCGDRHVIPFRFNAGAAAYYCPKCAPTIGAVESATEAPSYADGIPF